MIKQYWLKAIITKVLEIIFESSILLHLLANLCDDGKFKKAAMKLCNYYKENSGPGIMPHEGKELGEKGFSADVGQKFIEG